METATMERTRRATGRRNEKGGIVTVTKAPGKPHEVLIDRPTRISTVYRKAGIKSLAKTDITVGGKPAKASDLAKPGAQVVASPRIKAG